MSFAVEQAVNWEEALALGSRYEGSLRSPGYCRRRLSLLEDGSLTVYNRG